jgi:protein SCO1/2
MRIPLSGLIGAALALSVSLPATAHDKHVHKRAPTNVAAASESTAAPAALKFDFGGPFSLIDHTGVRRTDKDFRGKHMLVFFGYAQCQSICPVGLGRMAMALDELGETAERIQPIFITVDPDNDTPDVIAKHVKTIHPGMVGLTGTKAEIEAVARAYNVQIKLLSEPGDKEPIYAHGSFIFLMKPNGKFAALYPPVFGAEAIAASVRRYVE